MNKDFHYEGTYAAARIAGFTSTAAAKIAWAAQTVDECTKTNMNKYYPKFRIWDPVYTCETVAEMTGDEVSLLSDETSDTLQRVRKIWMPFHFLPGNTSLLHTYKGGITLNERDIRDFLCLCLPDSDLVLAMVRRTATLFHAASQTEKEDLLILIGIIMHVLADTWAHKYFTGTPNYHINCVNHITLLTEKPEGYDSQKACAGPTNYSIVYLGHGQIGHNPDYGCLEYTYNASWTDSSELFTKRGPDDFCYAFEQMEWALRCIQHNTLFTIREQFTPEKNWMACVRDVVTTPKADQTDVWRRQMADFVDYSDLPPYKFDGKKYDMPYFQAYARDHRSFVMGYLESALNIVN